jgi:hypothetical protein
MLRRYYRPLLALVLLCAAEAACNSYQGPITNAPDPNFDAPSYRR